MTEDESKKIAELEHRLVELHEKLESTQDARDEAKEKEASTAKKVKKKDWFSPQMLTAYIAVFGLFANFANDWHTNYAHAQIKVEEEEKDTSKDRQAGSAVIAYVDHRINDVADTCSLYLDAVIEAMPEYQSKKIMRFLEEAEGYHDEDFVDEEAAEEPPASIKQHIIVSPLLAKPIVKEKPAEDPKPINASSPVESNIYGDIMQQIEQGKGLDVKGIIEKHGKRSSIKRRSK